MRSNSKTTVSTHNIRGKCLISAHLYATMKILSRDKAALRGGRALISHGRMPRLGSSKPSI